LQQHAIKCSLNHLQESPTRIDKDKRSEDVSKIIKKMGVVICDYQARQRKRRTTKQRYQGRKSRFLTGKYQRWQFTLYKKMAAL